MKTLDDEFATSQQHNTLSHFNESLNLIRFAVKASKSGTEGGEHTRSLIGHYCLPADSLDLL
jgi:hypothetical protein